METVPDVAQAVVGYRLWRMSTGIWRPQLHSIAQMVAQPWSAQKAATCPLEVHPSERAPSKHCLCGIHAFANLEDAIGMLIWMPGSYCPSTQGVIVAGTVELYGKVLVHARGYRAEYARITGLYAHPEARERLENLARHMQAQVLEPTQEMARTQLSRCSCRMCVNGRLRHRHRRSVDQHWWSKYEMIGRR